MRILFTLVFTLTNCGLLDHNYGIDGVDGERGKDGVAYISYNCTTEVSTWATTDPVYTESSAGVFRMAQPGTWEYTYTLPNGVTWSGRYAISINEGEPGTQGEPATEGAFWFLSGAHGLDGSDGADGKDKCYELWILDTGLQFDSLDCDQVYQLES